MFVDLTLMLTFNDIHTLNIYIPLDQLIHISLIQRFIQDMLNPAIGSVVTG